MRAALALAATLSGCTPTIALPPQDIGGQPVVYVDGAALGAANAGAAWSGGKPTVYLTDRFRHLQPAAQWFVLAHELCHLAGHDAELDADCCAGHRLVALGIPPHLAADYLVVQPRGPLHPPGHERALRMLECYR